jgi:hypothetical protein
MKLALDMYEDSV